MNPKTVCWIALLTFNFGVMAGWGLMGLSESSTRIRYLTILACSLVMVLCTIVIVWRYQVPVKGMMHDAPVERQKSKIAPLEDAGRGAALLSDTRKARDVSCVTK